MNIRRQTEKHSPDVVDLLSIPFSRFGSFFVISSYTDEHKTEEHKTEEAVFLRDVHGGDHDRGLLFEFKIPEVVAVDCCETELKLKGESGQVSLIMPTENEVRIRVRGLCLELDYVLKKYDHIYEKTTGEWELCSYSKERKYGLEQICGNMEVVAPWDTIGNDFITIRLDGRREDVEIAIESYKVSPQENETSTGKGLSYDQARQIVQEDFDKWTMGCQVHEDRSVYSQGLANYITWANFVRPEGILPKYAMYMSKNWMTNIWSWDNCFGAIYLAKNQPDLAFDQFIMFESFQHETGCYPDYMNDTYASYSCVKPPVYGWAYRYMMRRSPVFKAKNRLERVYETVKKCTEFWMKERIKSEGLPYYTHGNDSGWDNGTFYMKGMPVASPDLAALLTDQMLFLSEIAHRLDRTSEGKRWEREAMQMAEALVKKLWDGDRFFAIHLPSGERLDKSDSLQALIPLIIARILPDEIVEKLVKTLQDPRRFNGTYGFATEAISSPYYRENGYWRGPVWAPVMLMLIDSVRSAGYSDFAKEAANKYIACLEKGGMAENHDPVTGEGLVDPAFAWTSSVYLTLLDDYRL